MKKLLLLFLLLLAFAIPALATNKFWVGGGSTANWAATGNTNWSLTSGGANNAAVPGTADDVFFDANSGTGSSIIAANITIKSLTTTNSTLTITHNASIDVFIQVGSLTLASGTYTAAAASSLFELTGNDNGAVVTSAVILGTLALAQNTGQSVSLGSAIVCSGGFELLGGTFSSANFNITATTVFQLSGASTVVSVGSSTITVTGTGNIWTVTSFTGSNFNAGTSTIVVQDVSGTGKTFAGGGLTYYIFAPAAGSGNLTITGSNVFNTITINSLSSGSTSQNTIVLAASSTQTVTNLNLNGLSGKLLTVEAASGTAAFSVASGNVCSNFLALNNVTATGGASFFGGGSSTYTGTTTGWTQSNCPTTGLARHKIINQ
jgi:hypothetical protein